jgi:large subunit ribosomal protein L17
MRHRLKGRKLSRTTAHRQALERNIVTSLFLYGRIVTTVQKAKEFRGTAEHLIQLAKDGQADKKKALANYRRILRTIHDKGVAKKVWEDVVKRFSDRQGGYTRVVKLGGSRWDGDGRGHYAHNRLGDNGSKAIWELLVVRDRDEELKSAGRGVEKAAPAEGQAAEAGKAAPKKAPKAKKK